MLQSFVPVLLLVTVALSSSNVLPILSENHLDTEPGFESQYEDNIFSYNRLHSNILDNIFYKLPDIQTKQRLTQLLQDYTDPDNNPSDYDDAVKKDDDDDNNGEGYRKEQWHNYPRQLDRLDLHKTSYYKIPDTDDPKNEDFAIIRPPYDPRQKKFNELTIENKAIRDPLLLNPLLVLKINLEYLVNDSVNNRDVNSNSKPQFSSPTGKDDSDLLILERYPRKIISGKKRLETYNESPTDQKKTVNKRLFSLWSRLQSLSHKGHELQHRRHIYTLYGLADNSGSGGTLTAETRAFMRPPGSPLRWG